MAKKTPPPFTTPSPSMEKKVLGILKTHKKKMLE
jgi:hypothetical protein